MAFRIPRVPESFKTLELNHDDGKMTIVSREEDSRAHTEDSCTRHIG